MNTLLVANRGEIARRVLATARRLGWRTVLIGLVERDSGKPFECAEADYHIARLHDLRSVAPDLFEG